MAKYEFTDMEEFLGCLKEEDAKRVGVFIMIKNEDAGMVALEKGKLVKGQHVTALAILTGASRSKTGAEDHYFHNSLVSDKVISSQEEADKLDKEIEAQREILYKKIQDLHPKGVIFNGKVLV
jgi:hypothetical protein